MKKLHFAMIVILSLLLLATICWGFLWHYAEQDTVPDGVIAGDIAIGGMQIDDALELLEKFEASLLKRTITIEANLAAEDRKQWTLAELGYRAEFMEIRAALQKLKEGSVWEIANYRYHFPKNYVLSQSWERNLFEAALRKQWSWIENNEPVDAKRTIADDDEVLYEEHTDAYRLELDHLIDEVEQWVVIKDLREVDIRGVENQFVATLPVTVLHPAVTLEQLKAEGIDRKIMSYTTDFASSAEGRAHNVTVTAETLHEWHLAPGEIFEYSKLVALAEEQHEYREAPVILNGKLVPGIGGGICQVSSTLYQAVLRAGLEIVERRNHSIPVAYMPLGHDATYAGGAIDFRFRNSTDKHLIIHTEVKDRQLTVKLFGTMPENDSYQIESVTVRTIAPEVKETTNASLSAGKRVTIEQGKQGFIVDTYRTHIRDGEAVTRERISRDTYRAQPTIIETGPAIRGDGI